MEPANNPVSKKTFFLLGVVSVLTFILILVSIFSLKNGVFDIFPFFYILPILILAYYSPRYAVYFTIVLGWLFLALVYLYGGPANFQLYATGSAWFYIFVSIGVVISALSTQLVHEKKYREIFENSQAGMFTFDMQSGKILEINERSAAIFGYSQPELKNLDFVSLWFDKDKKNVFLKMLEAERRITDHEIEFRKKDRTTIWVLVTLPLSVRISSLSARSLI